MFLTARLRYVSYREAEVSVLRREAEVSVFHREAEKSETSLCAKSLILLHEEREASAQRAALPVKKEIPLRRVLPSSLVVKRRAVTLRGAGRHFLRGSHFSTFLMKRCFTG